MNLIEELSVNGFTKESNNSYTLEEGDMMITAEVSGDFMKLVVNDRTNGEVKSTEVDSASLSRLINSTGVSNPLRYVISQVIQYGDTYASAN